MACERNGEIPAIPQEIICPLLRTADCTVADEHNPAISRTLLFTDLIVFPSRTVELWQDLGSAGIGFIQGHGLPGAVAFSELNLLSGEAVAVMGIATTIVRFRTGSTITTESASVNPHRMP